MPRNSKALLLVALLLGGCATHLETRQAAPGAAVTNGWSYNLAKLGYDVQITRTLTKCPSDKSADFGFDVAATATPTYSAAQEVLVDPASLSNGLKTISVSFENYPTTGFLKSVNATATDHTGDAIKSAVASAIGIAKMVIGVPPLPGGVGAAAGAPVVAGWRATAVCSDAAERWVAALATLKKKQTDAHAANDKAKAAVDAFDADHIADKDPAPDVKKARAQLATVAREAAAAASAQDTAIVKATATLTETDKYGGTYDQAFSVSQTFEGDAGGKFISQMVALRLLKDGQGPGTAVTEPIPDSLTFSPADTTQGPAGQKAIATLLERSAISIIFASPAQPAPVNGIAQAIACGGRKNRCGILYRSVAPVRLQICKETAPEACAGLAPTDKNVVLRDERNGPQFGGLRSLALQNDSFESNSLVATFNVDGSVATATYAKTSAQVVGALGSLNDAVNGATTVTQFRQDGKVSALNAATAVQNAQADYATAQAKALGAAADAAAAKAKLDALQPPSQ